MEIQIEKKPFIHRLGEPVEVNLKQFYELSEAKRDAHIVELKKLKFKELSDTDKGVVFFYYQNWGLVDWPGEKINFFRIEDIPTVFEQVVETVSEQIIPTVDEICEDGLDYVREYLNAYFELDYPDWEGNLKFSTSPLKFIEATLNFMLVDELTKVHIYAYKKLIK